MEIMMKNDSTILQYVISTNISPVHNIMRDRIHRIIKAGVCKSGHVDVT